LKLPDPSSTDAVRTLGGNVGDSSEGAARRPLGGDLCQLLCESEVRHRRQVHVLDVTECGWEGGAARLAAAAAHLSATRAASLNATRPAAASASAAAAADAATADLQLRPQRL